MRARLCGGVIVSGLLLAVALHERGVARIAYADTLADRIYVAQLNPTRLHSFAFDGAAFVEEKLDPGADPAALPLAAGIDSVRVAATDRFLLMGNGLTSLPLSIVDPVTRREVARSRSTAAAFAGAVIPSADGQFVFVAGSGVGAAPPAGLSVFDLRPSSPTFGQEVAALGLPADAAATAVDVFPCALDAVAGRLFISTRDLIGSTTRLKLHTIDVHNPLAPTLAATVTAQSPGGGAPDNEGVGANAMQTFTSGGAPFVLVGRRSIQVYGVAGDGSLTFRQSLNSTNAAGLPRTIEDFRVISTPAGDRAIAVTRVAGATAGPDEVIVVNMSRSGAGFDGTVLSAAALATAPAGGPNHLDLSSDGSTVYVLTTSPATLQAFPTAGLLAGTASAPVASVPIAPRATASGFLVRPQVAPPSAALITSVAVNGVAGAVLVNDRPRTLTVTGSGLASTTHLFVGLTQALVTAATDTQVTATVPALVPAATATIVTVGPGGSASATLTVANPPTYVPPNVVYSDAFAGNDVSVLNAATTTEVVRRFPTGQGPADTVITPDGKYLFVADFRGTDVTAHSLVDDAAAGTTAGQILQSIEVGGTVQRLAMSPTRPRVYATALGTGTVYIIGTDPSDPAAFLKVIGQATVPAVNGNGEWRSMTITPDGTRLLIGASAAPHLIVIDVSSDTPTAASVALPGLAGVTGRTDGLAVSPDGRRLYFMTQRDTALRVFDITNLSAPSAVSAVSLPATPECAVPAADNRRIQPLPDGRFVYISSRSRGCVDVYSPASNAFVASIRTGTFSGELGATPDSQFVFVAVVEDDAVKAIDARATVSGLPNAAIHSIVAVTAGGQSTNSATVSPGLLTPTGPFVEVAPLSGVTLTFTQIAVAGNTTVTSGNVSTLGLPPHFQIQGVPVFFDVRTTASFTGPVTACFPYDPTGVPDESALRVLHEEAGVLVDRTVLPVDVAANRICAAVSGFSQFVVAAFVNHAPIADAGPDETIVAGTGCSASVELDASASTDADGDPLTFTWTGSFGTATGVNPTISLVAGTHTVSLTATDGFGGTASDSVTVTVVDDQRADISSLVSVTLGPPNLQHHSTVSARKATIRNISAAAIEGPIWLVVDNLPPGVTLMNADGVVGCAASAYVRIRGGNGRGADLDPNRRARAELKFFNPDGRPITFEVRVVRGDRKTRR